MESCPYYKNVCDSLDKQWPNCEAKSKEQLIYHDDDDLQCKSENKMYKIINFQNIT
jgi:hypothetical protein